MEAFLLKITEKQWAFFVFLFAFAIYVNTIPNDYNLDDNLVTQNHRLTSKGISAIPEIFSSYYYEDEMGYKYGYRPIVLVSFAIEHSLFGENVHISHAINVFLFALTCLLIFLLLRKMIPNKNLLIPLFISLLFATHPIHTEVVASIKNRDELLSLLFGLLAFLSIFTIKKNISLLRLLAIGIVTLVLFVISILSKNSTVLLAIMIPLADLFFINKNRLLFPIAFSLMANAILFYFLKLSLFEFIYLQFFAFTILLVFYFIDYENRYKFIASFKILVKQKHFFLSLLIFSLIIFVLGVYIKNGSLIFFAVFISIVVYYFSKNKFLSSSVIFLMLSILSILFQNINFLAIAFIYFLIVNSTRINISKWKYSYILVYSIFIVIASNNFVIIYPLLILISTVYFLSTYYRMSLIVIPIIVLLSPDNTISVVSSFFLLFSVIWYLLNYYKINLGTFKNKNFIPIGFSLMIIFMLFSVSFEKVFEKKNNYPIEKNIAISEDIDRPLLFIENPLIENWNLNHRIPTSITTTGFYLKKMLLPYPLLFYYGYDKAEISNWKSTNFYIPLFIIFLLVISVFYFFYKDKKLLSFGILFMLINLVPYSNLMTPVAGIVGERLAYVSSLGFSMVIIVLLFSIFEKVKRYTLLKYSFLSLVLILFSTFTIYRNSLWKNEYTLFKNDIKQLDKSAQANALFAFAIMNKTKNNALLALKYFNKAIHSYPNY